MRQIKVVLGAICLTGLFTVITSDAETPMSSARRDEACNPEAQAAASVRLQEMLNADQTERNTGEFTEDADLNRRIQVSEIFAQGCLRTADDFYAAALIFQHGNVPEHALQAYLFASRAGELGHEDASWLIPRAVDRYLMFSGRKQLYATNLASSYLFEENPEDVIWCLWPVEESFPETLREAYYGDINSMDDQKARVIDMNGGSLPETGYFCPVDIEPSPPGSVPGHW